MKKTVDGITYKRIVCKQREVNVCKSCVGSGGRTAKESDEHCSRLFKQGKECLCCSLGECRVDGKKFKWIKA